MSSKPVAVPVADEDSAVADDYGRVICPVSTSKGKCKWTSLKMNTSNIMINAGYSGQTPHCVPCIWYIMGKTRYRFVHITKNAKWFLQCVGGSNVCKGDLSQVTVLEKIRESYFGGEFPVDADDEKEDTAVADDSQDDPMLALVEVDDSAVAGEIKKK